MLFSGQFLASQHGCACEFAEYRLMVRKARRLSALAALIGLAVLYPVRAQAGLTLTAAGIADGFKLSTYATGTTGSYSFLAAAPLLNPNTGDLAVIDFAHGKLRTYADVDGQVYGSALNSVSLPSATNIANAGGQTYATQQLVAGGLYEVSNSLGLTPVSVTGGFTPIYGFAGNPVSGHLLAFGIGSAGEGIYDINPLTGANTKIVAGGGYDGVSVSPDGTIVYVERFSNSILGYNIATHALVFSASSSHNPDGTGAISGGLYNGYVIANNNDGTVSLFDPTGTTQTIIASGGTRGDFTSPDTNNGTLLMSEYDFSYRLTAPGGSFGGVPEPSTLTIFGISIASMAGCRWLRRKQSVGSSAE
jgi:hypothetical protein